MSKGEKKKPSAKNKPDQRKGNDKDLTRGEKSGRDAREDRAYDKGPKRKAS